MLRTITSSTWKRSPKATLISGALASLVPLKTGRMNSDGWTGKEKKKKEEKGETTGSVCLIPHFVYANHF